MKDKKYISMQMNLDKLDSKILKKVSELRSLIRKGADYKKVKAINKEIDNLSEKSLNLWQRVLDYRKKFKE